MKLSFRQVKADLSCCFLSLGYKWSVRTDKSCRSRQLSFLLPPLASHLNNFSDDLTSPPPLLVFCLRKPVAVGPQLCNWVDVVITRGGSGLASGSPRSALVGSYILVWNNFPPRLNTQILLRGRKLRESFNVFVLCPAEDFFLVFLASSL